MPTKASISRAQKKWKEKNPHYDTIYRNLKKYSITEHQYCDLILKQNNRCALCLKEETAKDHRGRSIRRLSVDHCHKTGKVRGLLCYRCNLMLGYSKDDKETLKRAIEYLD